MLWKLKKYIKSRKLPKNEKTQNKLGMDGIDSYIIETYLKLENHRLSVSKKDPKFINFWASYYCYTATTVGNRIFIVKWAIIKYKCVIISIVAGDVS